MKQIAVFGELKVCLVYHQIHNNYAVILEGP